MTLRTLPFKKLVPGKVVLRNGKLEEEKGWILPYNDFVGFIDLIKIGIGLN